MKKKYKVKPDYVSAFIKLVDNSLTGFTQEFFEGFDIHRTLVYYNVLDLFCEEIPPEVEAWKEPEVSWRNLSDKVFLLIRMQSWADYHNKLDGFVADWKDRSRYKWGVKIEYRELTKQAFSQSNLFLFQISVSSEDRAKQMMDYFRKDIQSLIDKGLI